MNFKIGQVFKKNGNTYCVLDKISYNQRMYILFSVENKVFWFDFYEVNADIDGYNLTKIKEQDLFNNLMEIFEKKEEIRANG